MFLHRQSVVRDFPMEARASAFTRCGGALLLCSEGLSRWQHHTKFGGALLIMINLKSEQLLHNFPNIEPDDNPQKGENEEHHQEGDQIIIHA